MDNNKIVSDLSILFKKWAGKNPETIEKLPHSGSSRIYYRFISGKINAIGVYNQNNIENNAFIKFTKHFRKYNLNVPEIYAEDLAKNIYLIEDLGNTDLLSWIKSIQNNQYFNSEIISKYKLVLKELINFQITASQDFDYSVCYPFSSFNKEAILFDLNYFLIQYVKSGKFSFDSDKLITDFNTFADYLLQENAEFFMYRDFQARNIMLKNNHPYFIDYQGGRKGPLQYDVASLLYQAKANIPEKLRLELFDFYMDEVEKTISIDRKRFIQHFYAFALVRILQTLGAYGLRGLVEGKSHFIESIVPALTNLVHVFSRTEIIKQTPELKKLLINITENSIKNES